MVCHRNIIVITLFLLTFFVAAACQHLGGRQGQKEAAGEDAILRVGVTADSPPLVYRQNDTIIGLEPSLALKLGVFLKKKIVFVEVPWESQIDSLVDGTTDIIMSGMTITRNREYLVEFTSPYMKSGQILLVRLEDRLRFAGGVTDIMNTKYKIGTISGTVGDLFVTSTIANANEINFSSPAEAVRALIKKEIDVFLYDAPVVCYLAAKHQNDKLVPILQMATEEYLGWAVRKEDKELLAGANAFIESSKRDDSMKKEIKYWIPYLYR